MQIISSAEKSYFFSATDPSVKNGIHHHCEGNFLIAIAAYGGRYHSPLTTSSIQFPRL